MKQILFLCLFLGIYAPPSYAGNDTSTVHGKNDRYRLQEQVFELRYLVNDLNLRFDQHLNQKDNVIEGLNKKIKELESELYYTTESLRSLEIEVWDMSPTRTIKQSADSNKGETTKHRTTEE